MRRGIILLLLGLPVFSGCSTAYRQSVGATREQAFNRIFLTDRTTAWIAVTEALKSFRLDVSNEKAGFIQTRWTDNTADKNAADPIGGTGAVYCGAAGWVAVSGIKKTP